MAAWKSVNPVAARRLSDARKQLHHAAQLATAFGISYIPKKPDDSHTNLEWIESEVALASNTLDGKRISIRVPDLTLLIGDQSLGLRGNAMNDAAAWARRILDDEGMDGSRYTLRRHYEIPSHPVADGARFNARGEDLDQLARWYSNAATAFEQIRQTDSHASEVRCWPHHFDIATLITPSEGRSVGVGLEPGDNYYDEPYLYVNMHPVSEATSLPNSLEGGGMWHTKEWIGAVLPGSRLTSEAESQQLQVKQFLRSAIDTAKRAVTQAQ